MVAPIAHHEHAGVDYREEYDGMHALLLSPRDE
jgi:hypothetical protein